MIHIGFRFILMVLIKDGNVSTTKKNAEALLVASKKFGLDVNADENKYTV